MAQGRVMTTRVIAADLKAFDDTAKKMILDLADLGCRVRVSKSGHAIVSNDAGTTCSISRNMTGQNRASQNTKAQVKRMRAEQLTCLAKEQNANKHPLTGQPQEMELSLAQALHVPGFAASLAKWVDENPSPPDTQIKVKFTDDEVLSIEHLVAPEKEQVMAEKKPTPKDVAQSVETKFDCPHCGSVPGPKEAHCKKAGHVICPEPGCGAVVKAWNGMGPHKASHDIAKGTRPGWRLDSLTAQEKVDAIKSIIDGNGVTLERYTKVLAERDLLQKALDSAKEELAKTSTHGKDYDELLAEYEKVEKERDEASAARDDLQTKFDTLRSLLGPSK